MSIQMLKEQIREFGAANAIVALDPKTVEIRRAFETALRGKELPETPPAVEAVLTDLSGIFQSGLTAQLDALIDHLPQILDSKLTRGLSARRQRSQPKLKAESE